MDRSTYRESKEAKGKPMTLRDDTAQRIYEASPAYYTGTTDAVPWVEAAAPYRRDAYREADAALEVFKEWLGSEEFVKWLVKRHATDLGYNSKLCNPYINQRRDACIHPKNTSFDEITGATIVDNCRKTLTAITEKMGEK